MIDRRQLLCAAALVPAARVAGEPGGVDAVVAERPRVLRLARVALATPPLTITSVAAPRGGAARHDYYSEADYWWPDPARPGGPFVRRDGFSYPGRFDAHRQLLMRFGQVVPTLAAAWLVTRDARHATAAGRHLHAWFVDPATRMNPDLVHAQAIVGRDTGRAIGIIDTLQIVEVARAVTRLRAAKAPVPAATLAGAREWFAGYLDWLTTSAVGIEERGQRNNHGTCWLLQAACFAEAAGTATLRAELRRRLATVIVPAQIAADGSQPLELARTKPFGYSLFNMDVLASAAQLLSDDGDLWRVRGTGGGSIADAVAYMLPFIADRRRWPHARDVEHFDAWPVRHPALLFYGRAAAVPAATALWARLDPDPVDAEVFRNHPVRQPILWV
jgi:hypothetical protein